MKNSKNEEKTFRTFAEYKKAFYPNSASQEFMEIDNPRDFGISIARQSLDKFRLVLLGKRRSP
jgi:hypothetical protein